MSNEQSPVGGAQESQETKPTAKCKVCLESKIKLHKGYFKNMQKKWTDDNNKQWCGNVCPECHQKKVRNHIRNKRMTHGQPS